MGLASVTPPGVLWTPSTAGGLQIAVLPRIDLLLHLFGYASLAWLFIRAARSLGIEFARLRPHVVLLGVFVVAGFGLCIEGVQYVLPYRNASLVDAAVNGIGAILGALLAAFTSERRPGQTWTTGTKRD